MSSVDQIRAMYERFPCQSPHVSDDLILDLALGVSLFVKDRTLAGWTIMDAGCGSGHRLLGMAVQYPHAHFVGLDMSEASLRVAQGLAGRHGVSNVEFVHGYIGSAPVKGPFDLITSTGVIHCLDDPRAGLRWLMRRLASDGLVYLWLYHSLGEHQRLLDWELTRMLAGGDTGSDGLRILRKLGHMLSADRYGTQSAHISDTDGADQDAMDVDAYLHPIVRAYRFAEGCDLFTGLDVGWAAINGVNWAGGGKLIDLGRAHPQSPVCVGDGDLFSEHELQVRYRQLDAAQRAAAIELRLRPTGFTVVAGRGDAADRCDSRIWGNVLLRPADQAAQRSTGSGQRSRHAVR